MLSTVKMLLGMMEDYESDDLLNYLIDSSKEEAIEYCNLTEYTTSLDRAVVAMTIQKYNRIGAEGTTSSSSSGISETRIDGYSKEVYAMLNKNRKLVTR